MQSKDYLYQKYLKGIWWATNIFSVKCLVLSLKKHFYWTQIIENIFSFIKLMKYLSQKNRYFYVHGLYLGKAMKIIYVILIVNPVLLREKFVYVMIICIHIWYGHKSTMFSIIINAPISEWSAIAYRRLEHLSQILGPFEGCSVSEEISCSRSSVPTVGCWCWSAVELVPAAGQSTVLAHFLGCFSALALSLPSPLGVARVWELSWLCLVGGGGMLSQHCHTQGVTL